MFSQTTYMEQDSVNNHLALVKTDRLSKCTLSVQNLCYFNIKAQVKTLSLYYFSHVLEKWINKFETSQISKVKNIIKQLVTKQ